MRSLLDTVPEPMTVPAASSRLRAAWATSVGKLKVLSIPPGPYSAASARGGSRQELT